MKKIFLGAFLACALLAPSCKKDDKEIDKKPAEETIESEVFMAKCDVASLYLGDSNILPVDYENDQITFAEDRSIYMVSDMDYTKSYTLNIDGELSLNSLVTVAYTSVGIEKLPTSEVVEMEVLKVDEVANLVWLWDDKNSVGFLMEFDEI